MSNEKPIHEASWATQLDELEKLPGGDFNKEMAWNKLHQRLQPKSGSVAFFWRWSAAAIFLLLLSVPVMMRLLTKHPMAADKPATAHAEKISPASSVHHETYATASINNNPVTGDKDLNIAIKWNKHRHFARAHRVISVIRIGGLLSKGSGAEILENSLKPINIPAAITLSLPAKKKLKTVYINELGDPAEESPVTAHSTDIHHFRLKLAGEEVFGNPSGGSRTGGFIMLTKNTSPN